MVIININSLINKIYNNDYKWYRSKNFLIIISFLILSFLSCILLFHNGVVYGGSDTEFQWQRIMELRESFQHLNFFPQLSIYQYGHLGSSVMSMYPYINLFPIVIFSFFIKSNIALIYITFMFRTLSILIISYYSSYRFYKNSRTSYLFALTYGLSGMFLSYNFKSMDLGVVTVIIAMPLIIFGFIAFLNDNSWFELMTGMTITVFSHVLSTIFIVVFLFFWLLINYKQVNKGKLIVLGKAVGLLLLLTAVFWMNALSFYTTNHINPPITFPLNGIDIDSIIRSGASFNFSLDSFAFLPGIFTLIGLLVFGILFFKKFNWVIKQMYLLSAIIMLICSSFFPWSIFQNTPISILQFPWRLFIIPQMILSYVFAYGVVNCFNKKYVTPLFLGMSLLVICMQFVYQNDMINFYKNSGSKPLVNVVTSEHPIVYNNGNPVYSLATSDQFDNITKENFFTADYLPKESLPLENNLRNQLALYNFDKTLQFNYVKNNEFQFINNTEGTINELNFPFVTYNNVNYHVYMDGKLISSIPNKTHLLTIYNVPKGNHNIIIQTDIHFRTLYILITLVGISIYFFILYEKTKKYLIVDKKAKFSK